MLSKPMKIVLIILLVLVLGVGGFAWYTIANLQKGSVTTAQAPEDFWDETEVAQTEPTIEELRGEPTATPEVVSLGAITPTPVPIYETDTKDNRVYNILLVGTDSRAVTNDAEGRSDTMMLASYNIADNKVTLVSFMRDSYITRITEKGKFKGKLNASYSNGGVGELINTLNYNFDFDIQEYISVGFAGFWVLIDGFDGVTVNMTADEAYRINWRCAGLLKADDKRNYKQMLTDQNKSILEDDYEGIKAQNIRGEQSLWYCRDRYSDFYTEEGEKIGGGDASRIARQQYLIKTLYKKIMSQNLAFGELWSMYQYASQWMTTNISMDTLLELGSKIMANDPEIVYVRVPENVIVKRVVDEDTGEEFEYVEVNAKAEKKRLTTLLYGDELTATPKDAD